MNRHPPSEKFIGPPPRRVASPRNSKEITLIVTLAVCASLVFLNRTGIAFLFPSIQPQLHLSNAQLGQLMSATSFAWAVSSVCFSLASDALGIRPRLLIVICTLGFSAVGALSGAVTGFGALVALRIAMGVFEGPVVPLIQATVAGVSPAQRRGANLGMVIGGSALVGAVLAAPVMTGLANTVGWRSAFLAIALPGPFVAIGVWSATRPSRLAATSQRIERPNLQAALGLATQRNVLIGLIGAITLIGSTIASASFLPLYLNSLPAFTATAKILFFVVMGIAHSVGGIVLPAASDRLGRKPCLILACLCSALAPMMIALMSLSIWWAVAALLLGFLASGAFTMMVYVLPGETVPPQMAATTFAVLLFFGEIVGGATAPTLVGFVADQHGLVWAQVVCGALAFLAFLASLFSHEPDRDSMHGADSSALWQP